MTEQRTPIDWSGSFVQHRRRLAFALALSVLVAASLVAWRYGGRAYRYVVRRQRAAELAAFVETQMQAIARVTSQDSSSGADDAAPEQSVNRLLSDVSFVDLAGKSGSLRDYRGSILVVSVTSIGCPIAKKLVPALAQLPEETADKRVQFLLINPERSSSRSEMEQHAEQFPGWRYVPDLDAKFAQVLAARTTTETFVIDASQTLRFRGGLDDRFDIRVHRGQAANRFLGDALNAVRRDEPVSVQTSDAPGCLLGLKQEAAAVPVTWHNQISRMMLFNCVECHRPGEAAPFSLETYDQVVDKKAMIEYVMREKIMPPWGADHHFGHWRNDRYVADADKRMFSEWAASDCTVGDPIDAPLAPKRASGWTIHEPDLVLDVEPQEVPAEGEIPWRKFPLSFQVQEDMWVSEAEIRPSAPEVVHHAMLFVEFPEDDPRGDGQTVGESEASGGGLGFWLSYFPGRKAMILPQGRGKLIPKNGRIYIQLHYNPNGVATVDRTQVGFKLLTAPPERAVVSGAVIRRNIRIPPDSRVEFAQSDELCEDIRIVALMPHMHYRGAAAQVFLKRLDGSVETLLHVPKYDFDWQISYELREPLLVTKGSQIIIRHVFDNRADNPRNPDATQTLKYGMLTTDEMMVNFFDWEPAGETVPSHTRERPFVPR